MTFRKSYTWVAGYALFLRAMFTMLYIEVLQGGCTVEIPSTSERLAADRGHGVGVSIRNGIGLDGKRKRE